MSIDLTYFTMCFWYLRLYCICGVFGVVKVTDCVY